MKSGERTTMWEENLLDNIYRALQNTDSIKVGNKPFTLCRYGISGESEWQEVV